MNQQIAYFVEGIHQDPREVAKEFGLEIPADWTVWNAARPLYGHADWKGDFRHGIFYAAVDPHGESHQYFTVRNRELDGWVCQWTPQEEVIKTVQAYYKDKFTVLEIDWTRFEYADFVHEFFNIKDREIEEKIASEKQAQTGS